MRSLNATRFAVVEVADEGQGIALEDQQPVFGKFERAVNRNEVSGLGIGLFIVQNIVELHGGRVEVKSSVGQGSVFMIRLPGLEVQPGERDVRGSVHRRP